MSARKVRYRGRKRYPIKKKSSGISLEEIGKEYPSLSKIMFKETPKRRWTWKEKLYALFLWIMLLGMTYYLVKWLIGVRW